MPKKKNRIKSAVKKPGAFTGWCKSHGYGGVTKSCINAGKKSRDSTTRKRANLAMTFMGFSKKR